MNNPSDTSNTPRPEYGGRTSFEWAKLPQPEQAQVTRDYNAQLVREQRERVMALQVKIDEDRKAREQAAAAMRDEERRAKLEADVRRAFLEAGGTEAEFEESGPKLVRDHLEAVTAERMTRDRQAVRNRISQLL